MWEGEAPAEPLGPRLGRSLAPHNGPDTAHRTGSELASVRMDPVGAMS